MVRRTSESAQSTVEYALLVFCMSILALVVAVATLQSGVLDFYYDVASLLCLPIP